MLDLSWIKWTPDELKTAAEAALADKKMALGAIYAIPDAKRTFANTIGALEQASDVLNDLHQRLDLLVMVHPSKTMRDAAQKTAENIDSANIEFEYDRRLWDAVSAWRKIAEKLSPAEQKLADDIIRDLRRMGFSLPEKEFDELKAAQKQLQKLNQQFERAINESEDHIELGRERLAGLPERYIDGLKRTRDGKYEISLQYPEFFPFMRLADDDEARRELSTKNLLKGGKENLERLRRMIELRQRIAGLLGYPCYADFVQETYMAKKSQAVDGFLSDIIHKLSSGARIESQELMAEKQHSLGLTDPAPVKFHEITYWSEKIKKAKYGLDAEQLKEYFPLEHVLASMLDMYQGVLGLRFEKINEQLWHEDVELYSVTDKDDSKLLGYFALDLYPREGKYGHAASCPVIVGRQTPDGTQMPGFMVLICNFARPTHTNPSLMPPDDEGVETLLHEFGHVIHWLVSGNRWQRQNGCAAPLDFVETPSQAFEYWVWDPRSLAKLSKHYRTGETLSQGLISKFISSRNHQQASHYLAQAVRALFDLRIHSQPVTSPVDAQKLVDIYRDMKLEYEHIELPEDSLFPAGWGHMADYDAGYYSYLWSKVYASDLYTRFKPDPLNAKVGADYRAKVLAPGASRPEKSLVEDFLSRPSTNAAFLEEIGI